ncbi:hypothetical protein B0A48_05531 [Cryoendolithus antarcticus]|uniref:CENP-V/GFA domain-containing protein n=1 Tax=Cryoendolithus antarcticus TaxID=1507870 RepID=A0A1V8TIR4_9PEZI|nr:hypothetical protein B0A48_05531 [Cryoendolithus antarcticus]
MPPKTYIASCHCHLITLTLTLPDALAPEGTEKINDCTCSYYMKNGYLLVYPLDENVKFEGDCESKLASYAFATKTRVHKFCPKCGSSMLIDFRQSVDVHQRGEWAINARMIKGIDLKNAEYTYFDGEKLLEPQYV